jgi:hypothetical protein
MANWYENPVQFMRVRPTANDEAVFLIESAELALRISESSQPWNETHTIECID